MSNVIRLYVENPDELLNTGAYGTGAFMRVQSSATEGGAYIDISGTGSTPTVALVTLVRAYTAYDPQGDASTWYRTRYEASGGARLSDWSAPFQAGGEEAGKLCSLYDVKQRLGITDTTDDELLAEMIEQVSDEITLATGRSLAPDPSSGTKTVYLDCPWDGDGLMLFLPRGIRTVTYLGVATTDQPDGTGTYTEITSGGYYLDPPVHERSTGWPATRITLPFSGGNRFTPGSRTVKLTGSFGWASVPAAVRAIAEMMVVSAYRARGSGGLTTYTVGVEGERTYSRMLTTKDLATLAWYSDRPVP